MQPSKNIKFIRSKNQKKLKKYIFWLFNRLENNQKYLFTSVTM